MRLSRELAPKKGTTYLKRRRFAKKSSTNIIDEQKNRAIGIELLIIYC